jgi:hypothetical protein
VGESPEFALSSIFNDDLAISLVVNHYNESTGFIRIFPNLPELLIDLMEE